MRQHVLITILAVIGTALTACATSEQGELEDPIAAFKDDPRLGERADKICFQRNIDGFSKASRKTVVLEANVNDDYLVSIRGMCPSLRNAMSIGIGTNQSCLRRGDILIVSESAFSLNDNTGTGPDRCFIDEIYRWDDDAGKSEMTDN